MSAAAWESLHKATRELARSSALKQRLTDAFTRHLQDLPASDVPSEIREDFEALRQSMTRVRPAPGECPIVATVRKMSMGEADDCAARIVEMLDSLHRAAASAVSKANGVPHARSPSDSAASRVPTLISLNRA